MVFSLLLFVGAIALNNCPAIDAGACNPTLTFEAHNVIRFHAPDPPWICDGSVWWEATLDDADPVEIRCATTPTPEGDLVIYCPDSIAPVKHWDRAPGQSAWLSLHACNVNGCSLGCEAELVWPAYTVIF